MSNRPARAADATPADDATRPEDESSRSGDPVEDVPDGAGCTEIWERLSDARKGD